KNSTPINRTAMENYIPEEIARTVASVQGIKCSRVYCGGAAGSTFQLALGDVVARLLPEREPVHTDESCQLETEASIVVWCAWRLDRSDGPLTSWDDTNESVEAGLTRLIGARVDSIEVIPPAWDVNIKFSNSLCLRVFCDHVPGEPSFDG